MNNTALSSIVRNICLVTIFVILAICIFMERSQAGMTELQIESAIAAQDSGILPGARITGSSGSTRANFEVTVEFNIFEPVGTGFGSRKIETPGVLKIPNCYYYDDENNINWTDKCNETSPPATQITEFYDVDGNPISFADVHNAPLLTLAQYNAGDPGVYLGDDSGAQIKYNEAGNGRKELSLYVAPILVRKHPSDGSAITTVVEDSTSPSGYRSVQAKYHSEDTVGLSDPNNPSDPNDLSQIEHACDKDISNGALTTEYPPGYLVDYDGAGPLVEIKPGGNMYYPPRTGEYIYDQSCNYVTDCQVAGTTTDANGNTVDVYNKIKSGDDIYILQPDPLDPNNSDVCAPLKGSQKDPVRSVRGPETVESVQVPLFIQRFYNEFSQALNNSLLSLGPSGNTQTITFTGEQTINSPPTPYGGTHISFESIYEGDYLCIYAYSMDNSITWRIEDEFPKTIEDVFDITLDVDPAIYNISEFPKLEVNSKKHCQLAPTVNTPFVELSFSNMIADTCTDYSQSSSAFSYRDSNGNMVTRSYTGVVVECIEDTLINVFVNSNQGNPTFFDVVRSNFQRLVWLILVIYVILFGYRVTVSKQPPSKQEVIWFALKLALVSYFAIGPGMTQIFFMTTDFTKRFSTLAISAATSSIAGSRSGYFHCSFTGQSYPPGKEYLKMWDTLDCKMSKYLGIGDNISESSTPQVLWIGLTAIGSIALGLPIFIISVVVLIFLIIIIVKSVHIYILAFIGIIMLFFISPLIIPTVLFPYTKDIFSKWLQQIISYALQPIILFAFLAFAIATIDVVYFGNNKSFTVLPGSTIRYYIASSGAGGKALKYDDCTDDEAIGCIYQGAKVRKARYSPLSDIKTHRLHIGSKQLDLFIGLLKLLFICFIIKSLLSTVLNMVANLTGDGIKGGTLASSSIGGNSPPGPAAILKAGSASASAAANSVGKVGSAIGRAGSKMGAAKRDRIGGGSKSTSPLDGAGKKDA